MKTLITNISLLICSLLSAQDGVNKFNIDIRGKDCNGGLSFCTIEVRTDEKTRSQKFSLLKISETELQFTIKINELTYEEQIAILGNEVSKISNNDSLNFNQNYDFQLNSDCIKTLELNSKYTTIKNGIYPISLIDDTAIIILKLTNTI